MRRELESVKMVSIDYTPSDYRFALTDLERNVANSLYDLIVGIGEKCKNPEGGYNYSMYFRSNGDLTIRDKDNNLINVKRVIVSFPDKNCSKGSLYVTDYDTDTKHTFSTDIQHQELPLYDRIYGIYEKRMQKLENNE